MNILGFKGPRKMSVILPSMDQRSGKERYLSLSREFKAGQSNGTLVLKNKMPQWNEGENQLHLPIKRDVEESQSFVLDFNGRVTQASVKNFQLTPERDRKLS